MHPLIMITSVPFVVECYGLWIILPYFKASYYRKLMQNISAMHFLKTTGFKKVRLRCCKN